MHGNVWEWVRDKWHAGYDGAPADGSAWESGDGADRGSFAAVAGAATPGTADLPIATTTTPATAAASSAFAF